MRVGVGAEGVVQGEAVPHAAALLVRSDHVDLGDGGEASDQGRQARCMETVVVADQNAFE
jgi:hypothetical protein